MTVQSAGFSVASVQLRRRILAISAALYFVSQILFLINIQFPRTLNFDEFHYVPSAKQFLELKENQNYEHPPLGKLIMAASIGAWGDRPIGWRFASTLFGSLTLVGMYLWGLALFRDEKTALWVALITFANNLLYVQARIGMLDTFMTAFIVWAMAAFTALFQRDLSPGFARKLLYACGVFLGLATASKWFGVIPWVLCIGLVFVVGVLHHWRVRFADAQATDWYRPDLLSQLRPVDWLLGLAVIPVVTYFVTFLPYLFVANGKYGLWDLVLMQKRMWEAQGRVVSPHPYMSTWTQWPMMTRPIWYAFDKEPLDQNLVRGVVFLGNPLVMWTGLLALLACFWDWIVRRRMIPFLILAAYAGFYLSWMAIPRKVSFYYYYYPAGLVLSLALAYLFHAWIIQEERPAKKGLAWGFLAVVWAMFFYFLPILAALRIPGSDFRKWMWFSSWI